jgi:cyanophycinase
VTVTASAVRVSPVPTLATSADSNLKDADAAPLAATARDVSLALLAASRALRQTTGAKPPGTGMTAAAPAPSPTGLQSKPQATAAAVTAVTVSAASTATAATTPAAATSTNPNGGNGYKYFRVGKDWDVSPAVTGGLAMQGGGTDIDALFTWMRGHIDGPGDFLVIRAGGTDAYNPYIADLFTDPSGEERFNSVATLIIPNRQAAYNPFVAATIRQAEGLFIAGGNQADYIDYWKGTPVEDAIDYDVRKGDPLGGTSAGVAVMGQFLFAAEQNTITSSQALADPYDTHLTLDRDFVHLPLLGETITDTHFVARDRMGRLVTFLARIDANGWSAGGPAPLRGIGINEKAAVLVEPDGRAAVVDNRYNLPPYNVTNPSPYAYFLQPEILQKDVRPKTPLTYQDVLVQRVAAYGGTFDLVNWTGTGVTSYELSATDGVLTTDPPGGSVY